MAARGTVVNRVGYDAAVKRRLFNLAVAVSLVLCAASLTLWVRSYVRMDGVCHIGRWHIHNFTSLRGRLFIQWGWSTENQLASLSGRYVGGGFFRETASSGAQLAVEPMSHGWRLGGFDYFSWHVNRRNTAGNPAAGEWVFIIPWWFVVAVTGTLAGGGIVKARWRARRERLGQCLTCGYDLRATSDRCPECGTEVMALVAR
jgi:hypothetical protein